MQAGGKWQKNPLKAGTTKGPKPGDIWEKALIEGKIKAWLDACSTFVDDLLAASEPACLLQPRDDGHYYETEGQWHSYDDKVHDDPRAVTMAERTSSLRVLWEARMMARIICNDHLSFCCILFHLISHVIRSGLEDGTQGQLQSQPHSI